MENLQEIHGASLELIENIFRSDPYLMVTAVDDAYGFSAAYQINNEHYVVVDDGINRHFFFLPSNDSVIQNKFYWCWKITTSKH